MEASVSETSQYILLMVSKLVTSFRLRKAASATYVVIKLVVAYTDFFQAMVLERKENGIRTRVS
jgi:hypothetical protein